MKISGTEIEIVINPYGRSAALIDGDYNNDTKALLIKGSWNNDGDFCFLEDLSNRSMVGFAGRRHYSHKPARRWNWNDYENYDQAVLRK